MGKTLLICAVLNVAFAATSGLWGVLVTDFIQFGIAMTGSFAAAYFALKQPRGRRPLGALSTASTRRRSPSCPDFSDWGLALSVLIIPITIQWWSVWYPGAEPGGGSYIAQRMLASKSERDALAGTLFFNGAHYALRPWPWIIVALSSMLVFPQLADIARAFPYVDRSLDRPRHGLPRDAEVPARGLPGPDDRGDARGLRLDDLDASELGDVLSRSRLLSAFRSARDATERHYVAVGRLVTALLMVAAAFLTLVLDTARQTFDLLLSVGAGTGLIYLLRWFWWRINAWSEVAAMASSFLVAVGFFVAGKTGHAVPAHVSLVITICVTTLVWIAVTYSRRRPTARRSSRSTARASRRPRLALRSAPRRASPLLPTACRRPSSAGSSAASSSTRRSSAPAASSMAGPRWPPSGSSSSSPAAPGSSGSSPASGPAAGRDGILYGSRRMYVTPGSLAKSASLVTSLALFARAVAYTMESAIGSPSLEADVGSFQRESICQWNDPGLDHLRDGPQGVFLRPFALDELR